MKYVPLFTIEIEHDYFTETLPDVIKIVPTLATRKLLQGSGLIAKFFRNKLYVLVRYAADDGPSVALTNDFTLQFFLEVTGSDFSKITNLNLEDPYNYKLYLSNAPSVYDGNSKSVDNILYLNEKLPQFNAANAYNYNDLVRSGSDLAYEVLQKINAGSGNLNNSSQFRKLPKVSYLSSNTGLLFSSSEKIIDLEVPAPAIDLTYFKYNPASKLFDIQVKHTVIGPDQNPSGQDFNNVSISFYDQDNRPFAEGIYRILVNGQEEFIYFRPENDWQPFIGLINIHNNALATANEYRILQEDGTFYKVPPANDEIDTRHFKIRFAPSQYLLKYICKSSDVTNISDDAGIIQFNNLGGNVFQSTLPVRLSEKAIDTISVAYTGSDVLTKTKVPGYRNLSITDDDNKYIVSETFLNL